MAFPTDRPRRLRRTDALRSRLDAYRERPAGLSAGWAVNIEPITAIPGGASASVFKTFQWAVGKHLLIVPDSRIFDVGPI
jgi:hypothetical protein